MLFLSWECLWKHTPFELMGQKLSLQLHTKRRGNLGHGVGISTLECRRDGLGQSAATSEFIPLTVAGFDLTLCKIQLEDFLLTVHLDTFFEGLGSFVLHFAYGLTFGFDFDCFDFSHDVVLLGKSEISYQVDLCGRTRISC